MFYSSQHSLCIFRYKRQQKEEKKEALWQMWQRQRTLDLKTSVERPLFSKMNLVAKVDENWPVKRKNRDDVVLCQRYQTNE